MASHGNRRKGKPAPKPDRSKLFGEALVTAFQATAEKLGYFYPGDVMIGVGAAVTVIIQEAAELAVLDPNKMLLDFAGQLLDQVKDPKPKHPPTEPHAPANPNPNIIELTRANEATVRAGVNALISAFNDFRNQQSVTVPYVDGFMIAHNFHRYVVEDLADRCEMDAEERAQLYKIAVDTFTRRMMEGDNK